MKHWIWYALGIVILAALGFAPFHGTDVAKLEPVELIRVSEEGGMILVETDGEDAGVGADVASAFSDLKRKAAKDIFLETADYLLLEPGITDQLSAVAEYLRPACAVCLEYGKADLKAATAYLGTHKPEVTLQDVRAANKKIPALMIWEGRMELVQ